MDIYDKAAWHIDAGENSEEVIAKFQKVFAFLDAHDMLTSDGKEMLEFGIDSSISLNERMVTSDGAKFLSRCYDEVINCSSEAIQDALKEKLEH